MGEPVSITQISLTLGVTESRRLTIHVNKLKPPTSVHAMVMPNPVSPSRLAVGCSCVHHCGSAKPGNNAHDGWKTRSAPGRQVYKHVCGNSAYLLSNIPPIHSTCLALLVNCQVNRFRVPTQNLRGLQGRQPRVSCLGTRHKTLRRSPEPHQQLQNPVSFGDPFLS